MMKKKKEFNKKSSFFLKENSLKTKKKFMIVGFYLSIFYILHLPVISFHAFFFHETNQFKSKNIYSSEELCSKELLVAGMAKGKVHCQKIRLGSQKS